MLFKEYKIVYLLYNKSDGSDTDLELMTVQTSQGSYGLMLSRWDTFKAASMEGSNGIYKMFLLGMVLDTDGNTVNTQVMAVYTKPTIPKVEIEYNHFDTPVTPTAEKTFEQFLAEMHEKEQGSDDLEEPDYEEEAD